MHEGDKITELTNLTKNNVTTIAEIPLVSGGDNYYAYSEDLFGGMPKSTATKVVAASDTPNATSRADYECDGTNDDVEIQAAIDALSASGGKVLLLEGTFSIGARIVLGENITVQGMGWNWGDGGTIVDQQYDGDVFYYNPGVRRVVSITIRDLHISGHADTYATGSGIHFGNNCMDTRVFHVGITYFPSHGIHSEWAWGFIADDVVSENCEGDGIRSEGGSHAKITRCKLSDNDGWGLYSNGSAARIIGNEMDSADLGACRITGARSIAMGNAFWGGGSEKDATVWIGNQAIFTSNNVDTDSEASYFVHINSEPVYIKGNMLQEYTVAPIDIDSWVEREEGSRQVELFHDVLALSANHVVNAEDLSAASPIACTLASEPDVPRTLSWELTHANITEFTLVINGRKANGVDGEAETITEADGWAGETDIAFADIATIVFTREAGTGVGDTLDVGIADTLGISNHIFAANDLGVYKVKKNQADYTNYTPDADYDTVAINDAITGGDDYTIWYRSFENVVA